MAPTLVPPLVQSGAPFAFGPQTKKSTVPVTVPLLPLRLAWSVTVSPLLITPRLPRLVPPSSTWVAMSGFEHSENEPLAKSDSVESGDGEERVSATNEAKQPASRPRAVRSMPPSTMPPAGMSLLAPSANLSSNVQAGLVDAVAAMAQRASPFGAVAQEPPVSTRSRPLFHS